MKKYRIHPSIGIARVGNSTNTGPQGWYVGPETPDLDFRPSPDGLYREENGNIRRQAARFRIYEYTYTNADDETPSAVREITGADAEISWHVHLANEKPFTDKEVPCPIDPGGCTISGAGKSEDIVGTVFETNVQLGTLKTDDSQRLLALGGFGKSESPSGAAIGGLLNQDWYDDVSDGPVQAIITLPDGSRPAVESAWLVVGVPSYATPIVGIVTLYDLVVDKSTPPWTPGDAVSFTEDIYPVLRRAVFMQWASPSARSAHGHGQRADFLEPAQLALLSNNDPNADSAAAEARARVFDKLKQPEGGGGTMPDLIGLALTKRQYAMMTEWKAGNFDGTWSGEPPHIPFEELPAEAQPAALDRASLWSMVGGSFGPGIETGQIMSSASTYGAPLRVNIALDPGSLTQSLSVPWQADFNMCGRQWWPSGRPNEVSADGTTFDRWVPRNFTEQDMTKRWWELGFMVKEGDGDDARILEVEREIDTTRHSYVYAGGLRTEEKLEEPHLRLELYYNIDNKQSLRYLDPEGVKVNHFEETELQIPAEFMNAKIEFVKIEFVWDESDEDETPPTILPTGEPTVKLVQDLSTKTTRAWFRIPQEPSTSFDWILNGGSPGFKLKVKVKRK